MFVIPDQSIDTALAQLLYHVTESAKGCEVAHQNPRTLVDQLDSDAEAMRIVLTEFTIKVQRRIALMRRHYNKLLRIHLLPEEILADILLRVVREADDDQRAHCVDTIAQVSTSWRCIVLETAQFWVNLHSRVPITRTKCAIERSKQALLHIHCAQGNYDETRQMQGEREGLFLTTVAPFIERWRTFSSDSAVTPDLIQPLLQGNQFPMLRTFALHSAVSSDIELPTTFWNNVPRLREVAIGPPLSCPLTPGLLAGLTSITFTPYIGEIPFTQKQWLLLLRPAAQLQTISIHGASLPVRRNSDTPDTSIPPSSLPSFHLPALRAISLNDLSPQIVGMLLSSLSLQPEQVIDCKIENMVLERGDELKLLPTSPPCSGILAKIRRFARSLFCRGSSISNRVILEVGMVGGSHFSLTCTYGRLATDLVFRLMSIKGLSLLTELQVHGLPWLAIDAMVPRLPLFRGLKSLKISDNLDQTRHQCLINLCHVLYTPLTVEEKKMREWPCPNLTHLSIKGWRHLKPIVRLMEIRYGTPSSTLTRDGFPLPLERLCVGDPGTRPEFLEQIRKIASARGTQVVVELW